MGTPKKRELDEHRKMVLEGVKKFEERTQEIHEMADKLHKKMEELHLETIATRKRAQAAREKAEARRKPRNKPAIGKRKVGSDGEHPGRSQDHGRDSPQPAAAVTNSM